MSGLRVGFDLGTTSLAGRLWDESGQSLAEASLDNPQQVFGADVILRLAAAQQGAGDQLQRQLCTGINVLLEQLLKQAGCRAAQIGFAAAAANPAISHFLAGQPVEPILAPPHRPSYFAGEQLDSALLGLKLPVPLYLLPLVSGYVGGDLLALLLGSPPATGPTLYVDLGTNAELGLWDGTRWLVTSAAAGPAFEAGNIGAGMDYGPGAVTDVVFDGDRLRLNTAGNVEPCGLCGSGLVALVAAGLQGGLIDGTGRIVATGEVETNLGRYLVPHEGGWAIRFHRSAKGELLLTQTDLRNFQFARGAVLAGVRVLLQQVRLQPGDVAQVLVTGSLGTALPVETLKRVALLPDPMIEKSLFVANGVLAGLGSYLAGDDGDARLKALLGTLQPFPLSGTPAFERLFLASLEF